MQSATSLRSTPRSPSSKSTPCWPPPTACGRSMPVSSSPRKRRKAHSDGLQLHPGTAGAHCTRRGALRVSPAVRARVRDEQRFVRGSTTRSVRRCSTADLQAVNMPREWGGAELTTLEQILYHEQLGGLTNALWDTVWRPSNALRACTAEQRERYLLPASTGRSATPSRSPRRTRVPTHSPCRRGQCGEATATS